MIECGAISLISALKSEKNARISDASPAPFF